MLRNISASDPDRVRRHLPTDLGDMSVEIRDEPVVCRRFVPTGSVQGLVPLERTSTGEILDDTRRLRRPRHASGVHLRAGKPALRLPTAKPAPGAMDRRVERRPRFGSFHSVEDHRVVPIEPPPRPRWPRTAGVAPLRTTQRSRSSCGSRQAWLWWLCIIRVRVSPMIRRLVSAS
jgi:hypothetical protein